MRIKFTNTDSDGNPVTSSLTVTFDGERYVIEPASTGTANVEQALGEYIVESARYDVEEYVAENEQDAESSDETDEE